MTSNSNEVRIYTIEKAHDKFIETYEREQNLKKKIEFYKTLTYIKNKEECLENLAKGDETRRLEEIRDIEEKTDKAYKLLYELKDYEKARRELYDF